MSEYLVGKTPSGKPKRNGWVGSSGSSSGDDFKLRGTSHVFWGGSELQWTGQAQQPGSGGGRAPPGELRVRELGCSRPAGERPPSGQAVMQGTVRAGDIRLQQLLQ